MNDFKKFNIFKIFNFVSGIDRFFLWLILSQILYFLHIYIGIFSILRTTKSNLFLI